MTAITSMVLNKIGSSTAAFGKRTVPGVPAGAQPPTNPPTKTTVTDVQGNIVNNNDQRVKIRVPEDYFSTLTSGPDGRLQKLGAIIFPYTPQIQYELKADYTPVTPLHSNFPINFYKNSSISTINITGKFTVENSSDAEFYLATVHLLKALTRMRFGTDSDKGSPPPVCRLEGYGDAMLKNVPIVIANLRIELQDSVDYYTYPNSDDQSVSIPVISSLQITCLPMYSRREMQQFSVTSYIDGSYSKGII